MTADPKVWPHVWLATSTHGSWLNVNPQVMHHLHQKSGYDYRKRPFIAHLAYLTMGPGIMSMHGAYTYGGAFHVRVGSDNVLGDDHHRHRKIMNPAFSTAQLRTFVPLFQRIASEV